MFARITGRIRHVPLTDLAARAAGAARDQGEGVLGEGLDEILRREAELVAEAGLASVDGSG
ncbi:MAG: hypothetical protein U1F37_00760 [Alphaproteobacteria bacterium]